MKGYCKCGCGQKTTIASKTHRSHGMIKGEPMQYIRGHQPKIPFRIVFGSDHPLWKGGKILRGGYCYIHKPNHPHSNKQGYIAEHRLTIEKAIGKIIPDGAEPHHVNCNRSDNRNTNLVLCEDSAYHKLLHQRTRACWACGHANWRYCWICRRWDHPNNMYNAKNFNLSRHNRCQVAYNARRNEEKRLLSGAI